MENTTQQPSHKNIKPKCRVDGCESNAYAKGMCHTHYDQMRLHGKTYTRAKLDPICSFEGCTRPRVAKGLCDTHWAQQNKGHPLTAIKKYQSIDERFDSQYIIDPESGCWVWQLCGSGKGGTNGKKGGYARFSFNKKNCTAHRFSYERYHGVTLSKDDTLDHLCRNTLCVNPEHLEKVSRSENTERKHLYYALRSENMRFREFILSIGEDPERILGGQY